MGIPLYGNTFANHLFIPGASSPEQYGIGINSVDGGFRVGSSLIEPCPSEVCSLHSSFYGLGFGIYVGRTGPNRPFSVHQAEFSDCFIGIENNGVSGADIVFNEFIMGNTHELTGEEDQIGISISGYMAKFSIQENKFAKHGDNADFMLGIRAEYLGEMNNEIRRNFFDGLSVGNEAFALSADLGFEAVRGLNYLCNENTDLDLNDFYLPQSSWPDYIREWQCLIGGQANRASGNTFSLFSGNPSDGDYANYGDWGFDPIQNEWRLKYFYDENKPIEIPVDYFGIEIISSIENSCISNYCPHPCLDKEGFELEKADFDANSDNYKIAYISEEFQLAAYYRNQIDSNIYRIFGYLEFDTAALNRDNLRAWYKRSLTLAGDLMLAGDYAYTEEYTRAIETLDSIPIRHVITASQQYDIDRLKTTYSFLSSKSIFNLSDSEIDSLFLYSQGYGASYTTSRAILAVLDSVYTPRYYVPGEINPRRSYNTNESTTIYFPVLLYPNPVKDELIVEFYDDEDAVIELYDLLGKFLWRKPLRVGQNQFHIDPFLIQNHLLIYRISTSASILKTGILITKQ